MMLEFTCLGHATLLVRTARATLLCDPILGDAVSGGGNVIHPARTVHVERLPPIDAILLSHHHSDHFSMSDLALIPGIREMPLFAPEGSAVIDELRQFGCSRVEPLRVGTPVDIKGLTVIPTPSAVDFPEVGFLIRSEGVTGLNLVDTQIHGVMDDLRRIIGGPVQFVLAPFQAGGYMSLLPLRVGGPPDGLADAIGRWSEEYTEELATDLALLAPQYVVPFADGLLYRDDGINAWHFPLPDEEFLKRMAQRGIPGSACAPGSVFSITTAEVEARRDEGDVIILWPRQAGDRTFNPHLRMNNVPMSCADWNPILQNDAIRASTEFLSSLRAQIEEKVSRQSAAGLLRGQADHIPQWFLEFCDCSERMVYLFLEPTEQQFAVRLVQERPPARAYGLRLHGCDLLSVLTGRILLEHITLGGAFRYHSPQAVDNLERIRGRVFGPLYAILGLG